MRAGRLRAGRTIGNSHAPIISDGDLLSFRCAVCARNADLLAFLDVPANVDLGLDAVDVVNDGRNHVAAFSTELDSSNVGQFTAGDLLDQYGVDIWLSTEVGHTEQPEFGDQDLLGYQASFVRSGASLVDCFEPYSKDLGLDAVVPEPNQMLLLGAGVAFLRLMLRRRASQDASGPRERR